MLVFNTELLYCIVVLIIKLLSAANFNFKITNILHFYSYHDRIIFVFMSLSVNVFWLIMIKLLTVFQVGCMTCWTRMRPDTTWRAELFPSAGSSCSWSRCWSGGATARSGIARCPWSTCSRTPSWGAEHTPPSSSTAPPRFPPLTPRTPTATGYIRLQ